MSADMDYAALLLRVFEAWVRCVIHSTCPHGMDVARGDAREINGRHVADIVLASAVGRELPLARLHAAIPVGKPPQMCTLTIGLAHSIVRHTLMGSPPVIDTAPDYRRYVIEHMAGHAASIIMGVPFEKPTFAADGTLLFLQWPGERRPWAEMTLYFNQDERYFTAQGRRMEYTAEAVWEPPVPQRRAVAEHVLTMEDFL